MADKQIKIPGPDHPISIEANPSRVVVKVGGKIIADTTNALTLREASYPAVQYIPRRDVADQGLRRLLPGPGGRDHATKCPDLASSEPRVLQCLQKLREDLHQPCER